MFWPFLLLGALVMGGWSLVSFTTGAKGTTVLASSPMGKPLALPHGPDDSAVLLWITGGDQAVRSVDCAFGNPDTHLYEEFGRRTMAGPDGETYRLAARIGGRYVEGSSMSCTSPSGATGLLLAQDAGRTTLITTGLTALVGLGAFVLAVIGYTASRRQRARITPPSAGPPPGWSGH